MKNFKFYWEENARNEPNIKIDVPGFGRDEIHVKISSNLISINAAKKHHKIERGRNFYKEESASRMFSKSVSLPHNINPEDFEVSISDGRVVLKRKKKIKEKD